MRLLWAPSRYSISRTSPRNTTASLRAGSRCQGMASPGARRKRRTKVVPRWKRTSSVTDHGSTAVLECRAAGHATIPLTFAGMAWKGVLEELQPLSFDLAELLQSFFYGVALGVVVGASLQVVAACEDGGLGDFHPLEQSRGFGFR